MAVTLANFPEKYDRAVILYAAAKVCLHNLKIALSTDIGLTSPPFLGDLEVISPVDLTLDLSSIPDWEGIVLPELPVPPILETSITVSDFTGLSDYEPPTLDIPDYEDANTWLNTEEDAEMVSSRVQIITAQLQQYNAEVQGASSEFTSNNVDYQASIQKNIKDADLKLAVESQKLQEYASQLQSFSADVQAQLSSAQNQNSEVAQKFQEAVQTVQTDLSKYQAEIQAVTQTNQITLGKFSTDLQLYSAQLQEKSGIYNWNIQQYSALKNEYIEIFGIPQSQQRQQEARG